MTGGAVRTAAVLIGTYTGEAKSAGPSKGIYRAAWDGDRGVLGAPSLLAELKHPSFLARHPRWPLFYAVSETGSFGGAGAVGAFGTDGAPAGPLRSTGGASPCHATVDPRGEFLVVANYTGGNAAVFALDDGRPAETPTILAWSGRGRDAERQAGPHAHSACFDPSGDRFYVMDLGTDRIWGFSLDRAGRTARPLDPPGVGLAPGSGPRHLAFHPASPWAYVINELDNTVTALRWDRGTGRLEPFQTVPTLPANLPAAVSSFTADVHVSPDGAFLYGSNRGHDSLAVWAIDPGDGRLAPVQHESCGGAHPRNFLLTPDGRWLLCANMNGHSIVVFSREARTGRLARVAETPAPWPVCLLLSPA